jgi:hypothetical protein
MENKKIYSEVETDEVQNAIEAAICTYNDEAGLCWIIENHPWLSWKSKLMSFNFNSVCAKGMEQAAVALLDRGVEIKPADFNSAVFFGHRALAQLLVNRGYKLSNSPTILGYVPKR